MEDRRPSAAEIIDRLGGNPRTGRCACPAHDDTEPSLDVREGDHAAMWICRAGCTQEAVLAAVQALGIWPEKGKGKSRMTPRPKSSDAEDEKFESFRKAVFILRAATQAKNRPVAYLEARGIKSVPANAAVLPAADAERLTGKRYPAMVLPVTNERDELQGAHVTWLSADASAKLAVSDRPPAPRVWHGDRRVHPPRPGRSRAGVGGRRGRRDDPVGHAALGPARHCRDLRHQHEEHNLAEVSRRDHRRRRR